MNIYVIYAPISPITLVLAFSSFDCRFMWIEPSNWRKNEPWWHRRSSKAANEAQNDPKLAKFAAQIEAPKEIKAQRSVKERTGRARGHHGLAIMTTTALGGTHGRASPLPPAFRFSFRVAVRLPAVFAVFPFKYRMYLDIQRESIYIPFQSSILSS